MIKKKKKLKFPSELRFDLISRDWVVIATGRAKRPEMFKKEKRVKVKTPKRICPFCQIETQEPPVLIYSQGKKVPLNTKVPTGWTTIVIPNKFPAFLPQPKPSPALRGKALGDEAKPQRPKWEKKIEGRLYQTMNAVGFSELVVTRDHEKSLALLSLENVKEVIDCYQERYLTLMKKLFVNYVSIFHNEGIEAGASQSHPHSQIITTPLIDIDLQKTLANSQKYFKTQKKCIYCQMNNWERKVKKRVVFENKDFLVICPFASKSAFQVIVSPKRHLPYFEKIREKEKWQLAEAFKLTLEKLYQGLGDPAYNFYLHTAPCDGKDYPYYHWHFTILPKTGTWAGFELGVRMEISTIEPEKAAEYLRKQ